MLQHFLASFFLVNFFLFTPLVNDEKENTYYIQNVVTIRADSLLHIAFPSIIRCSNDSLLLVYREAKIHQIDSTSHLVYQKGSVDGLSWSKPEILLDVKGMDERDPSLSLINTEKIALTFFGNLGGERLYKPYLNSIYFGYLNWNSLNNIKLVKCDDGLDSYPLKYEINHKGIWIDSTGKEILMHCTSSPLLVLNGKYIIPGYGIYPRAAKKNIRVSPPYRLFLLESMDEGGTWSKRLINQKKLTGYWLGEPSIIQLDEAHLLMHIRTAHGRREILDSLMQAESLDDGRTWINYKKHNFIGQAPDLFLHSDGTVFSAFREIYQANEATYCSIIYSINQGKSWSIPIHIEACPNFDCGYPSIIELLNGDIFVAYYADMGHSIKGVILKKTNSNN